MTEVKIQCPECGGLLQFVSTIKEYMCKECYRDFTEAEIRERCGL